MEDSQESERSHRHQIGSDGMDFHQKRYSFQTSRNQDSNYYSTNDIGSRGRPIYASGFMGSHYERYINEGEFMRQTKSLGATERLLEFSSNGYQRLPSTRQMKQLTKDVPSLRRQSRKESSTIHFDSLIALMAQTIMGSSKRSFEKKSSTNNKIGLTPRRFTHDGRTAGQTEPTNRSSVEQPVLPPIGTSKASIYPSPSRNQKSEQRPLGMVLIDRCAVCSKKLGIATTFRCRCDKMFCAVHKFPEEHECDYDYKKAGREQISKDNPIVDAQKLNKI